ncbi:hypothetical protein PUN28_012116 [Cardiocondyla obscurior]|uniref:Odorant receptor n=4 Tax=Cardiocondyla obscurior TaxID=286306 RepID=A0AAW2FCW5_9HYME
MQILSLNILLCTLCGIWRPIKWSSVYVHFLYSLFTCFVLFMEYFYWCTQMLDLIFTVNNVDEFVANSIYFITLIAVACKCIVLITRRDAIINLIQILLKAPCKPQNEEEIAIQTKFDVLIRTWSLRYIYLVIGSATSIIIGSIFNMRQGQLPTRVWIPWDLNTPLIFWIMSIQQILSVIFGSIINLGTETLIFGFLLQTCAQLEIFENRIYKLINNKAVRFLGGSQSKMNKSDLEISNIIQHHITVYNYAKLVNVTFNPVLFVQFFVSTLVICTCVYYISTRVRMTETGSLVMFTVCMFVEIFIFCWAGNEVMLKSMIVRESIYHTNWPLISVNEKKELMMIMMRSTIPIKFTSSFLITLSLQSYSNILKMSYSAFNVLKK